MKTIKFKDIEKFINKEIQRPLSTTEMHEIMGEPIKIMDYQKFQTYNDIDKVLGKKGMAIILYTLTERFGHWCCIFKTKNNKGKPIIEWFDSYGFSVDDERDFVPKEFLNEQYNKKPHVVKLFYKSKYNKRYSHHRLQGKSSNTCGRWVIMRLKLRHLNENKFNDLFTKDLPKNMSPDFLVTLMTHIL